MLQTLPAEDEDQLQQLQFGDAPPWAFAGTAI